MNNSVNLLEQFLEFEKEHKLFELQYKGVYYWHLIRVDICILILYGEKAVESHPDMVRKSLRDKMGFIPFIPNQIRHYFDKKQYDLLVSYAYSRKDVDGKMINPFTWFITDNCDYRVKTNTVFGGNWTRESPDVSNNALIVALRIPLFIYSKVIQKICLKGNLDLQRVISLLNMRFSCNISYTKYLNQMKRVTLEYKLLKRYYLNVIKDKFRAIIIGCHYDLYNYALVAAARECGIPTIELQHGANDSNHLAYNFSVTDSTNMYLPKYIFMFGDYWVNNTRLPSGTTALSVGFPFMDYTLELYKNLTRTPKAVVFYSDGIIGPQLSRLAIRFSEIAVPQGYKIIYKFHPSERLTWRVRYPWLAISPNIEFEDRAVNVHEILASAKHHVGVASTVLCEALVFGGFVYAWEIGEKEPFLNYVIQEGFAQTFKTEKQLLEQITSASHDKDIENFAQQFYKPDAENNIFNALQEIMDINKNT